jgi:large subunit ribosomal protein L5
MISIEKVTVNIGVGGAGEKLEKAKKLLEKLTGQKPIEAVAKKRIPTWNVRPGLAIGAKVTLRGKKAIDFLNLALDAVDRKVKESNFDSMGNFSIGIHEYIDMPGFKYDPEIGILGFDVCATIQKWGYRVKKRKRKTSKVPRRHAVTKAEAMEYFKKNFNVVVE